MEIGFKMTLRQLQELKAELLPAKPADFSLQFGQLGLLGSLLGFLINLSPGGLNALGLEPGLNPFANSMLTRGAPRSRKARSLNEGILVTIHTGGEPQDYPYYEETVTESTWHFKAIEYLHTVLDERYADRQDVFVGANNFVYWDQTNKERKQAPDVYLCFGARNMDRRSYKTWEEGGIAPQVVFEVTSESSRFTDQGNKRAVYEALGVEEYYLFDPVREYIPSGLLAFRARRGILQPLTGKRIFCPRLALDLRAEGPLLRLFQPGSSQRLLTYRETKAARQVAEAAREVDLAAREVDLAARLKAEAALQEAEAARQEAEIRATRLQAELVELRRKMEGAH